MAWCVFLYKGFNILNVSIVYSFSIDFNFYNNYFYFVLFPSGYHLS